MNISESIRVALRGLSANKLRSGLTMLGIIIGVAAVIALLSIGEGAQAEITSQVQGIGSNLILIFPGALTSRASMMTRPTTPLTLEDAQALADPLNCPSVGAVSPEYTGQATVVYGGETLLNQIVGATADYPIVRNATVAEGRFLELGDDLVKARVAVLGSQTATDLFGEQSPVDQSIKINRIPFRVIGVMESKGGGGGMGGGGSEDTYIYVPISTAQTRLFNARTSSGMRVSTIYVMAVDEDSIDQAMSEITAVLRQRHKIQYQEDDFTVLSQKDLLSVLDEITNILTIFLGAIAAISLLVGGIGIMNIMLVSVTERTREIGIRKAVGAKRRDILSQFLIEAVVLSLIGGALGIALGMSFALAVNLSGAFTTVVSMESVLLAVSFSLAVGLFFGIYPATRAASLNPIDALRYE
ncbi:MAG: ABC transporter permease [Chloroflexi bacterium]|nr:ABC transporter permease [Chloroflexota bacterium]MBU1748230.1 ABC transporter permease [Chloroflexota bacterium]